MKRFLFVLALLVIVSNVQAQYQRLYMADPDRSWYRSDVTITENIFSVKDKGSYSEVSSYLTFKATNPEKFNANTQIELISFFQLPEEYQVSNLWLWVGDDIMEARIYDKWTAQRIYEGIVDRKKDPALLIKQGPSSYELRIYPFKPSEERKIRITYLIPNTQAKSTKSITLPNNLQVLSSSVESNPGLLIWGEMDPEDITISGFENVVFDTEVLDNERYITTILPAENNKQSLVVRKTVNTDSISVYTYSDGEESFYDLSLLPFETVNSEKRKRVLILIDYLSGNTSLSKADVIAELKRSLHDQLDNNDEFNLFISGLSTSKMSETWISADSSSLENAFDSFDFGTNELSNLDNLLVDGYDFLSDTDVEGASIVLVSSSQAYTNITEANSFLDAIRAYGATTKASIYIADIQTKNYQTKYISGRTYYGNEYLYSSLSRETKGELFDRYDNLEPTLRITQSLSGISGKIENLEVYSTLQNGLTYSKFNNNISESISKGASFSEVGKFLGDFPFEVQIAGVYEDSVFNKSYTIEQSQVKQMDSTLKRIWAANKIKQLEQGSPSNEQISTIISLSVNNRLLSKYTAFLALEPSDTVAVCTSCTDESSLVSIDDLPDEFAIDSLSAYPNPFNPSVNIELKLKSAWNSTNSSVDIFNVLGQNVAKLNTSQFNGRKAFTIRWDATGISNLATGVYLVRVKTPEISKVLKITYLR
jgi:Ca-activated chloride channel family protein